MGNNPPTYEKGITRVSNIVEFAFPFAWTEDEKRYLEWLSSNNISPVTYLKYAQEMWTKVHNAIEDFIDWLPKWKKKDQLPLFDEEVKNEILFWIDYIKELDFKNIFTERYVKDKNNLYQGTCDLLIENKDWTYSLQDWKTYWICQKRFPELKDKKLQKDWLPSIDTKKRNKVQLQMSLYAKALRETEWIIINDIKLLFLHNNWLREVSLDFVSDDIINEIISNYYLSKTKPMAKEPDTKIEITAPLKIRISSPPLSYYTAEVSLDLGNCANGKSAEENLNEALIVHKKIHNYIIESYGKST